jgi:hypothetical protein
VCDCFKCLNVRNLRVNFNVSPAKTYRRAALQVTVADSRHSNCCDSSYKTITDGYHLFHFRVQAMAFVTQQFPQHLLQKKMRSRDHEQVQRSIRCYNVEARTPWSLRQRTSTRHRVPLRASGVPTNVQKLAKSNSKCMAVTHATELAAGREAERACSTAGTGPAT